MDLPFLMGRQDKILDITYLEGIPVILLLIEEDLADRASKGESVRVYVQNINETLHEDLQYSESRTYRGSFLDPETKEIKLLFIK